MKALKKILFTLTLAGLVLGATASTAQAGSITCPAPGTYTDQLDYTLTWSDILYPAGSSECLDSGVLPGEQLPDTDVTYNGITYEFLEKDNGEDSNGGFLNITGFDGHSGTFTIDSSLTNVALGLKAGGGGLEPDWVIIGLSGIFSGGWALSEDGELCCGLSHANLWGEEDGETVIPEPASLLLLGSGLGLAAAKLRRRRT